MLYCKQEFFMTINKEKNNWYDAEFVVIVLSHISILTESGYNSCKDTYWFLHDNKDRKLTCTMDKDTL